MIGLLVAEKQIGTASMLPVDEGGVVDDDLCVYGVQNIRVVRFIFQSPLISHQFSANAQVDASIIPIVCLERKIYALPI